MTRDLLEAAIGTPPPSTIDVHRLVRHERRARAARGAGLGAAALAALALGGFVIGQPHDPDPAPSRAQPVERAPADNRFQLLANDKESADATAKRLGDALTRTIVKVSPSTTWVPDKPGRPGAAQVLAEFTNNDKVMPYFFSGGGLLATDSRHGVLNLLVVRELRAGETYGKKLGSIPLKCAGESGCTQSPGPHGEHLFTRVTKEGPAAGARIDVRVALAGGRILVVNTEATSAGRDPAGAGAPPLTAAQLRAAAVELAGQTRA